MIFGLSRRRKSNRAIVDTVYAKLTEAGRQPQFYSDLDVPDTVMGRFELIAAHVIVFLRRTTTGGQALSALGQDIVDLFFLDLDHSMREIGIGDTGVPKRMKQLARMFYGRFEAYDKALAGGDVEALAEALARNVHPRRLDAGQGGRAAETDREIARHLLDLARWLDSLDEEHFLSARFDMPTVAARARPVSSSSSR